MVIDAANWRCVLYCTTGGGGLILCRREGWGLRRTIALGLEQFII